MNFNSGDVNMNNNNRCNGYSVRGVVARTGIMHAIYKLTKERLRKEVDYAFHLACQHKKNKLYVKNFCKNQEENLNRLTEDLYNRRYQPSSSFCFIIHDPKTREIFAACFLDRIVHHLYFNMTAKMYETLFIEDSYSCRLNKGSHYGVERLFKHIRKATDNYKREAYILQLDMKGYFINIDRNVLLNVTEKTFEKMKERNMPGKSSIYENVIDFDFVRYLNKVIITHEPSKNCILKSPKEEWKRLPDSKSLFKTKPNCGLPIGNLTSQLLSNVYLNELDQFVKRKLKCKHYGRYVDDLFIVSKDKKSLRELIPLIRSFLERQLHIQLNEGKTKITSSRRGVQFLGYFVKEYRIYLCNKTLSRIKGKIYNLLLNNNIEAISNSINSYLGMFKHCSSYKLRRELFGKNRFLTEHGIFNEHFSKYILYNKLMQNNSWENL